MRAFAAIAIAGCLALGCKSADFDGGLEKGVAGGVVGGIGHDVCAVYFVVDVQVADSEGVGVESAEVWFVPQVPRWLKNDPSPPARRARLLGVTDPGGRLKAPECYMAGLEFRVEPPQDSMRFEFRVVREGYGARRIVVDKSSAEVLSTGNVLGKPLGDPLAFGYHLVLEVTLPSVTGAGRPSSRGKGGAAEQGVEADEALHDWSFAA